MKETLLKKNIIEAYKEKTQKSIIHRNQLTTYELDMLDFCIEYFISKSQLAEIEKESIGTQCMETALKTAQKANRDKKLREAMKKNGGPTFEDGV